MLATKLLGAAVVNNGTCIRVTDGMGSESASGTLMALVAGVETARDLQLASSGITSASAARVCCTRYGSSRPSISGNGGDIGSGGSSGGGGSGGACGEVPI